MSGRKDFNEGYEKGKSGTVGSDLVDDILEPIVETLSFGMMSNSDDYQSGVEAGREDRYDD